MIEPDGRIEHVGIGQSEWTGRLGQFGVRHDALDHGGGQDVDDGGAERAEHAGEWDIPLRVLDRSRVLRGRFHARNAHRVSEMLEPMPSARLSPLRVPGRREDRWAEPEPADDRKQADRDDDAPHRDRADASREARTAEVRDRRQPEQAR